MGLLSETVDCMFEHANFLTHMASLDRLKGNLYLTGIEGRRHSEGDVARVGAKQLLTEALQLCAPDLRKSRRLKRHAERVQMRGELLQVRRGLLDRIIRSFTSLCSLHTFQLFDEQERRANPHTWLVLSLFAEVILESGELAYIDKIAPDLLLASVAESLARRSHAPALPLPALPLDARFWSKLNFLLRRVDAAALMLGE